MEKTITTTYSEQELQTLITDCVRACLNQQKKETVSTAGNPPDFKYIPIQDLFKKKVCSKPTFYDHLKKGEFHLYKFGNKSFVEAEEFLKSFHKVQIKRGQV
jgi:hypothetical protein